MGSCAAVKRKNEEAVLGLIGKDFQDRLSGKKKSSRAVVCPVYINKEAIEYTYTRKYNVCTIYF